MTHSLPTKFFKTAIMRLHRDSASQRGVVALLFVFLILFAVLGLTLSVVPSFINATQVLKNVVYSQQAYYAAESGVEDAMYRITNNIAYPSSYSLNMGSGQTTVTVTTLGASKTVESDGSELSRIRKIQNTLSISSSQVSFHFAAQVGSEGLSMGDGSSITGNVFSDGDIVGPGVSKGTITGTAQVAGSGTLKNITVNGDAYGNTLSQCSVGGTAYYVSSISNCPASSTKQLSSQVQSAPLPISQTQIDQWKSDAAAGGTLTSYTLGNNASGTLGPKEVNGDITLGNGTTLTLTGTVWVTGTIHPGNTDIIQLDPGYGTQSGVLLTDGSVNVGNGVIFNGSGQSGSSLMLLSTFGPDKALDIGNTAGAGVFYAPNGKIDIGNGGTFVGVTGNGLELGNSVNITYQTGLASDSFTSGPGGGWQLTSWKEIP